MRKTLSFAGDIEITKIEIVGHDGARMSLIGQVVEMNLYEDLFNNSISASFTVLDTNGVMEKLPIIGEEVLVISYITPAFPREYECNLTLHTYKLEKFFPMTTHKVSYILHAIGIEGWVDQNTRLSRAFAGTSNIVVNQIMSEFIKSDKKLETENSSNMLKFVAPMWSPFKCINWFSSRAMTTDSFGASNFLFFETNKRFRFVSLNTLLKQPAKMKYFYDDNTLRDTAGGSESVLDIDRSLNTIKEIMLDQHFDVIKMIEGGAYANVVYDHNLLVKQITKFRYDYVNDFSKTNHLGKEPLSSKSLRYTQLSKVGTTTTVPYIHDIIKKDLHGRVVSKRFPLLSQLDQVAFDITVHGRSDVEVGDVVFFDAGEFKGLESPDELRKISGRYSGNYLIVSIMHRIKQGRHEMVMKIVKESVR